MTVKLSLLKIAHSLWRLHRVWFSMWMKLPKQMWPRKCIRQLKPPRWQQQWKKTSLENNQSGNADYFMIITSSSHPLLLAEQCKWTGRSTVEVNIENERLLIVFSRCRKNLKFWNWADYIKELYLSASCTCSTIIYSHSTNQIIVYWCCRSSCGCPYWSSLYNFVDRPWEVISCFEELVSNEAGL